MEFRHVSVLLNECIEGLNIKKDGIYVDGTLGGGGHSLEIVKRLDTGRLIGIDQDTDAISAAKERLKEYEDKITYVHNNFVNVREVLNNLGIDTTGLDDTATEWEVTYKGYKFKIDLGTGKVTYVGEGESGGGEEPGEEEPGGEEGITASEIANAEDKSQYYGARVEGYECTNSAAVNAWKIFYADENNIYIIADDYIPTDYCPEGKSGGTVTTSSSYPRGASFSGVYDDYAGSSDITDEKIKALNNDYFTKGYTSTNANMKSVAYMLDTNAWSVFAGDKAEYAIGGPPVEMLMKSYSQKHGVDYRAQASSDTGYQISNNGGSTWANYISGLDTDDSLYVINSDLNANGMWLASPSAIDIDVVVYVNYYGDVGNDYYYSASDGFRPLVCLQSNVHLQKNADGSYTIK